MTPAECFPVGSYLQEELAERGWTTRDCSERMGGNVDIDTLALDFLIDAQDDPRILLDDRTAAGIARATGTNAETWLNLDRAYHQWQKEREVHP